MKVLKSLWCKKYKLILMPRFYKSTCRFLRIGIFHEILKTLCIHVFQKFCTKMDLSFTSTLHELAEPPSCYIIYIIMRC